MGRPAKRNATVEKKPSGSSSGSSSASRDPTQRSAPKSIPRLDGNRDPHVNGVLDYTRPTDLKNISEFLGIAGWYTARGVSTNAFPSQPTCAYLLQQTLPIHCLGMQTRPRISAGQAALRGILDAYKAVPYSSI